MAIPADIMEEFGINTPESFTSQSVTNQNDSDTIEHPLTSIEDKIFSLYGSDDKSAQPVVPQPEQAKQPNVTPEKVAPQTQQPVAAQSNDPWEAFNKESGKAFFTESGDLDSQKINDYFLTNGKSFLKYATPNNAPIVADEPAVIAPKLDPEKEYRGVMQHVFDNFAVIIEDQMAKGYTHEQAINNLHDHIRMAKADYDQKVELKKAIEEQAKQLAPEIEQAREDRISAKIYANITELSTGLDGLINGMKGQQVLDQLVLNPKYGGSELDRMLKRDIPAIGKMQPEEKTATINKWFRSFQADKEALAHVAEFGRLRWQVENFKPILEHAQGIGAQKATMQRETVAGGPSSLVTMQPAQSGNSRTERFFSNVDSVN